MVQDAARYPKARLPPSVLYNRMNTAPNTQTPRILSGAPHIAVSLPGWVSRIDRLILSGFSLISREFSPFFLDLARITGTSALILPHLVRRRFPVGCSRRP